MSSCVSESLVSAEITVPPNLSVHTDDRIKNLFPSFSLNNGDTKNKRSVSQISGGTSVASINPTFTQMLADLSRTPFENNHLAYQTIQGLARLERDLDSLDSCDRYSTVVNERYGLPIHAQENYQTLADFKAVVRQHAREIREFYITLSNPIDKERFFKCALASNRCFEGRAEDISDYIHTIDTPYGLLKYEYLLLSHIKDKGGAVELDELLDFVQSRGIDLASIGIDIANPRQNPAIQSLEKQGFIQPAFVSTQDKLGTSAVEFFSDEGINLGRESFKAYLLEHADSFTEQELLNLDAHLDQFLRDCPDYRVYILE